MKSGAAQIIGKTIKGVIATESPFQPNSQIFILFSDNTYYEFYGSHITSAGGIDKGGMDAVLKYISNNYGSKVVFEAIDEED